MGLQQEVQTLRMVPMFSHLDPARLKLISFASERVHIMEGEEFIRFSGVVNPFNLVNGNTVSSTQVADARIELRGQGQVDEAQVMGWLARFFLTFLPF